MGFSVNGKGSRRRTGANDAAFKAAPWPPPSPLFRKMTGDDSCILQDPVADCEQKVTTNNLTLDNGIPERPEAS